MYWVEFGNEKFKFMESGELTEKYPDLLIDFLSTKIEINTGLNGNEPPMRKYEDFYFAFKSIN